MILTSTKEGEQPAHKDIARAGIVLFPKGTVNFFDRGTISDMRYPADRCIKPDLIPDHIDRHISLPGYDLQPGFLTDSCHVLFGLHHEPGRWCYGFCQGITLASSGPYCDCGYKKKKI